jgi:hypothetical protein
MFVFFFRLAPELGAIGRDELLLIRFCSETTRCGKDADEQELVPTVSQAQELIPADFQFQRGAFPPLVEQLETVIGPGSICRTRWLPVFCQRRSRSM